MKKYLPYIAITPMILLIIFLLTVVALEQPAMFGLISIGMAIFLSFVWGIRKLTE